MITNGLARAAIRFKPSSFVGTFVALAVAAMVVCGCGVMLETGIVASAPTARYASVPVVVAADPESHLVIGHGDDRDDNPEPVPDRARLDAGLVPEIAALPGVRAALPDLAFPVEMGTSTVLDGRGWGATAFDGTHLTTGAPPRAGQVVLDDPTARARGIAPGARVTLTTATGPRRLTVSGLAAGALGSAWFADGTAEALSGHLGRIDAIAVLARPGTTTAALAGEVRRAVAGHAEVYTGKDRGTAEVPAITSAREFLVAIGGSFGGTATAVAILTMLSTVALGVAQRGREFALLRAVGAKPWQIRRSLMTEALIVAPVAGAIGCLPGVALARWWLDGLRSHGAVPAGVQLSASWVPYVVAIGACLLTAAGAGLLASWRPARIKPGRALGEAAVEPLRPAVVRTVLGAGALAGGIVVAGIGASETGDGAAMAALAVVMLFMLALGLLGPIVARVCSWLLGLPLRGGSAPAALAAQNTRANARRLASAITPIALAVAFASTLVFMQTSDQHAATRQERQAVVADQVITRPGGLAADVPARAAATPGVTAAVGLMRTEVLTTYAGDLSSVPAQGVSAGGRALAAVEHLGVRAGSLDALTGDDTVAIDTTLAASANAHVGEVFPLRLPDGTATRPTIVAIYSRGLGTAQVTLPSATLATHVTSGFYDAVMIRDAPDADGVPALRRLGTVAGRTAYAAEQDKDMALNAWANTTMAAILAGFAAVAAANTLAMTVLSRRREFAALRLVGTTRRQALRMVRWEALLVATAGVALGTVIALVTLFPMMRGITGTGPYIPPFLYATFGAAAVVLALAATSLPARAVLRGLARG